MRRSRRRRCPLGELERLLHVLAVDDLRLDPHQGRPRARSACFAAFFRKARARGWRSRSSRSRVRSAPRATPSATPPLVHKTMRPRGIERLGVGRAALGLHRLIGEVDARCGEDVERRALLDRCFSSRPVEPNVNVTFAPPCFSNAFATSGNANERSDAARATRSGSAGSFLLAGDEREAGRERGARARRRTRSRRR